MHEFSKLLSSKSKCPKKMLVPIFDLILYKESSFAQYFQLHLIYNICVYVH